MPTDCRTTPAAGKADFPHAQAESATVMMFANHDKNDKVSVGTTEHDGHCMHCHSLLIFICCRYTPKPESRPTKNPKP